MSDTIDNYFKNQNVYDIKILSTLGLTYEDIEALSQVEGVDKVYGEYSEDILLDFEDVEIVTKVLSIDEVNKVSLLKGRMPENSNECLVEESFITQAKKKIGDTLTIEGKEDSLIKEKEVVIVGTMNSPLYVSRERDTSKLGSGKVSYNMYLAKESFAPDVYTEMYITLKDSKNMKTGTDQYKDYVQEVKEKLEKVKEERQHARYEEVKKEATEKLEDAKSKLEEEKGSANKKLKDAEKQITDGEKQLQVAQKTLNTKKKETEEQFTIAENKIKDLKKEIEEQEKNIPNQEQEAIKQITELEENKKTLQENIETINSNIQLLEAQYRKVEEELENSNLTSEEKANLEAQKAQLETTLTTLKEKKEMLIAGISTIEDGINTIKNKLKEGKNELEQAKKEIAEQEIELTKGKQTANNELQKAQQEINNSKKELEKGKTELEKNRVEYEQKMKDAEKEIADAEQEIEEIENSTWYILDRTSNTGYTGFIQDTQSIENIGKVFPIVFFAIATLLSLNSMTRMVEEERVQIGTLKALGYSKVQIARKYLLYASLACIIGGVLGILLGFNLLPKIVWMMYSMMYTIPNFSIGFIWDYAILGLGIACICIIGSTLYTVLDTLRETPAELMRPKAPKPGKRVLLEKISFIWKHLSFSRKVTVRNIFRYKKRFLMTIIGIAGCTALIVTGFGIRDSISGILLNQYEKVYHFDMQVTLKNGIEENNLQEFIKKLKEKEEITKIIETCMTSITLVKGDKEEAVQVIVPKDESIKEVIKLTDIKTKENITLDEGKIAITDKVAQILGVKKGDTITLRNTDNEEKEVEISNVVENYIYHYIYMPKGLYEEIYEGYKSNVLYVQNNIEKEQEEVLAKDLLKETEINTISLNSTVQNVMDDMISSLNYVVVILIVSAGLLAFVVLYNLSNLNISERIRELATIKVLGFYDKEVYDYVTRETVLLTVIGIILGLLGGYFLNYFIMETCEIDVLRFPKVIEPISYIYGILITVAFTLIVNVITYFALKKIDMIESLKSVE